MVFIERVYETPITVSPQGTEKEALARASRLSGENFSYPTVQNLHYSPEGNNTYVLSDGWHEMSPFYSYTLTFIDPSDAILTVSPKNRYDSNRYHSSITKEKGIVSRRGKTVYRIGTSAAAHGQERMSILTSEPRRGRKRTKEFLLVATVMMSVFSDPQQEIPYEAPSATDTNVKDFLEKSRLEFLLEKSVTK